MKPVIGLGAGGHAKVIIDILRDDSKYRLVGLLDRNQGLWGAHVAGVPILGGDDLLAKLFAEGTRHVFMGVGTTGKARPRQKLYEAALAVGFEFIQCIHRRAVVSPSAKIGCGVVIMAEAVVNADAKIGHNAIINTGAVVEHDCCVGDHAHIATGAALAGAVRVGDGSHVGIGAVVRQNVRIGCNAIVGAGAVVVRDVPDNVVVAGVPARFLKTALE